LASEAGFLRALIESSLDDLDDIQIPGLLYLLLYKRFLRSALRDGL
jgi:hypothetical protein